MRIQGLDKLPSGLGFKVKSLESSLVFGSMVRGLGFTVGGLELKHPETVQPYIDGVV